MKSTYDFIIQIFKKVRLPFETFDEDKMTRNIKIGYCTTSLISWIKRR